MQLAGTGGQTTEQMASIHSASLIVANQLSLAA
jgi:hypothetical protein